MLQPSLHLSLLWLIVVYGNPSLPVLVLREVSSYETRVLPPYRCPKLAHRDLCDWWCFLANIVASGRYISTFVLKDNRKEPQHLYHKGTTTFVTGRPGLVSRVFNTGWRGKEHVCGGLKMAAGPKSSPLLCHLNILNTYICTPAQGLHPTSISGPAAWCEWRTGRTTHRRSSRPSVSYSCFPALCSPCC